MFTKQNTSGFSDQDIDLCNAAIARLVAQGIDEKNAEDIVNNNWIDGENTVESLMIR